MYVTSHLVQAAEDEAECDAVLAGDSPRVVVAQHLYEAEVGLGHLPADVKG
jgi:hypothetical protein